MTIGKGYFSTNFFRQTIRLKGFERETKSFLNKVKFKHTMTRINIITVKAIFVITFGQTKSLNINR
jgi:hypothetical protein